MKQANPQGKGSVPVLDAWRGAQPARVHAKPARQILADYFTTLLVLSAEFRFKPVPGQPYHMYLRGNRWRLTLIAPAEWHGKAPGAYLGRCELQTDMTWTLEPAEDIAQQDELTKALQAFQQGFVSLIDRDDALEDGLPFYVRELPFYQRLLASGLASSLRQSLEVSRLTGNAGSQWLAGTPLPRLGAPD